MDKYLKLGFLLNLLLIFGCGTNPAGPLPPISNNVPSFTQQLDLLVTPSHTYFWLKEFSHYDFRGQLGWDWIDRGMPDLAFSLAYSLWETKYDDTNVGVCGQFASMYVVAAREHGYDSGFLITYNWDKDGLNMSGHAQGWIVYNDNIYISDNQSLYKSNYKTKSELFSAFSKEWFNDPFGYGWIANNKMEVIYDKDGYHNMNPLTLSTIQSDIRKKIVYSIGYKE